MAKKRVIDLDGPEGNAFNLTDLADRLCKKYKMDFEVVKAEMLASDYDNLVKVFKGYFSNVVLLHSQPQLDL